VQRSSLPRPAKAPHGRESARHLEATSRDAGEEDAVEGDEERDLSRRRAEEAALYMESRCDSTQAGSGAGPQREEADSESRLGPVTQMWIGDLPGWILRKVHFTCGEEILPRL
jgi:hypothetical protein